VQELIEAAFGKMFSGASSASIVSSRHGTRAFHGAGDGWSTVEIPAGRNSRLPPPGRPGDCAQRPFLPDDIRVPGSRARAGSLFMRALTQRASSIVYFVWNHAAMNPLLQNPWRGIFPVKLDVKAMACGGENYLLADTIFKSFAATTQFNEMESNVRTFDAPATSKKSGEHFTFIIEGRRLFSTRCAGASWGTLVAGRAGEDSSGGKSKNILASSRPAGGGDDGAGAWVGAVEGVLFNFP